MVFRSPVAGENAATRPAPGFRAIALPLLPALAVVIVLFGGGLLLGLAQALGYVPGAGAAALTAEHFRRVVSDPDFWAAWG
jgi:putative spermidine/putrescine transport system permease protein